MTPDDLKKSILQLALQGKLVPQLPEEGSAEELYKAIQKAKQSLVKSGKIKKGKPLSEITEDEIPFDIPENWEWVRVGSIFDHNTGKTMNSSAKKADKPGSIRKFITTSNVYWNTFDFTSVKEMFFSDDELERCKVTKGDMLMCEGGAYFGRAAIWNLDYDICFQNHIHRIRPYGDVDLMFFYYVFYLYRNTGMMKSKGTAMPGLSSVTLHEMIVPLPPLAEQKRIVAKIEELLPLVDQYGKAWEQLEQLNKAFPDDLKKSILQFAIQGKLVPQLPGEGSADDLYKAIQKEKQAIVKSGKIKKGKALPPITEDEIPFDIPDSWKWVRVGNVVHLNPKNDLSDNLPVSFIPMTCVQDGYRNSHSFETRNWGEIKKGFTHFANEDIGVAKITPCFQNKKSVIFSGLINGYGAGTTELSIVRILNNSIDHKYLLYFFKSGYFITNGIKSFSGTAGQQRIHKDYLATCPLPLPPLAEQHRIVARIEELFAYCDRIKF